MRETSPHVGRE